MPRPRIAFDCKHPGCPNSHQAQGYCGKHYSVAKRAGTIRINQPKPNPDADNLWDFVKKELNL